MRNKLIFPILFLSLISFYSCSEESTEESNIDSELVLVSDKGFVLAKSEKDLINRISNEISNKSFNVENTSIASINYSYIGETSFAEIIYVDDLRGISSNLVLTDYNLSIVSNNSFNKCSDCKCYAVTCTGDECRIVKMTPGSDGPQFECTCAGCVMNVRQLPCPPEVIS